MNRIFVATTLCYLTLALSPACAQHDVTFGKVSLDEVKMKTYTPDTTAAAVILSDIGKFNGNTLKFTRHIRVKILSKAGLGYGNWVFNNPSKGDFRVFVFNLEGNEVVKEKTTDNSIYDEEIVDGFHIQKVFAPSVRVGSVIDIQYSFFGMPFEWRFQERIPVVYSSLTLEPNQFIQFTKAAVGFEPIETISNHQWRAVNMPAFKTESFLNHYSNYITKFTIQLVSVAIPGRLYKEFSTTWRAVVDYLLEHDQFGQIINNAAFLNDYAHELKEKKISTAEKATEAYRYIQKNIKWSGVKSVYLSSEVRKNFLTDHVGNSADINLLLCTLLQKAGVPAYPIVLSTRENGMLLPFSPAVDKLNYVVVMVEVGNATLMLDATSEDLAPGIVPSYCLNGNGLLIKKDNEQWFNLNRGNAFIKKQYTTVTINPAGNSTVTISQELNGYAYADWMEQWHKNNMDIEMQKNDIQRQFPDTRLVSYTIDSKDKTTSTSKETLEFDISDQVIDTGSELIFNPLTFLDYSQNPLKSEERKYPMDLIYPKEYNSVIVVALPSGYSVSKLPESIKFSTPDGNASFFLLAKNTGTNIQFKAVLKFKKHIFDEHEYSEIRNLYATASRIITTPIELIKTPSK